MFQKNPTARGISHAVTCGALIRAQQQLPTRRTTTGSLNRAPGYLKQAYSRRRLAQVCPYCAGRRDVPGNTTV